MQPIKRALISVSDKTGIAEFAQFLVGCGVEILSTGGTAALLREAGIAVTDVAEVTQFPEMLDGRVKTLHPAVHGALLARRDQPAHLETLATHVIAPIDLLVVNLYPFEATVAKTEDAAEIIEQIDIGGPAMIRSAAKNFDAVTVVVDRADLDAVRSAMAAHAGAVPGDMRRALSSKAFARTSAYDTAIARWFAQTQPGGDGFPDYLLGARKSASLRYGENPHQAAALYRNGTTGVANARQLQGKELSYNNLNDTDAAWALVQEFTAPAVALIKHANPCGVAVAGDAPEAFAKALACDPVSAFGGILATNRPVDALLIAAIGALFLEVIIAPEVTEEARALLAAKKNLRVLVAACEAGDTLQIKSISGGYLVQREDCAVFDEPALRCVTRAPASAAQMDDLRFAFTVAKHVKSNAIVLAKNGATIGIGAGQMSRIDSVKIACEKALTAGLATQGAVLASDAFFPFADNVEAAHAAGVAAIIQPGGSVRDAEVIAAADAADIAMVFTGMRHFRH